MTKNQRPGFTLTEVVMGLMLVLMLLVATYSIFILSQQTQRRVDARAEVVQNQRSILDRIVRELRQANIIVTALPANEILFEDGHGNLLGTPLQYIRYYLAGTDLHREVSYYYLTGTPQTHVSYDETDVSGNPAVVSVTEDRLVGQYVTSLSFTINGTIIVVSLTVSQHNQTLTLTANVAPRNTN